MELYAYPTPNALKVVLALEELGLPYRVHTVDILRGEQHAPSFRRISPAGKIPALRDPQGPDGAPITLFESAAILWYLAEREGRLLPSGPRRYEALAWLSLQVALAGPMLGQLHHFQDYAPVRLPYAIERYRTEARRIYQIAEQRLQGRAFWMGAQLTLVDYAFYPWLRLYRRHGIEAEHHPALLSWIERLEQRPAVQRGLRWLRTARSRLQGSPADPEARRQLFGEYALQGDRSQGPERRE